MLESTRVFSLRAQQLSPEDWRSLITAVGQQRLTESLHVAAGSHVLLQTCERVELICLSDAPNRFSPLAEILRTGAPVDRAARGQGEGGALPDWSPPIRQRRGDRAIAYLIRLASGLESRVLGETQVCGQLRRAWLLHQSEGLTDRLLDLLLTRVLNASRFVRRRSNLESLTADYTTLAISRLGEHLDGSLETYTREVANQGTVNTQTVQLLGSGRLALEIARAIRTRFPRIRIELYARHPSRTPHELRKTVEDSEGAVHRLAGWCLATDSGSAPLALIAATASPRLLVYRKDLKAAAHRQLQRPLLLLDLGSPANIEEPCLAKHRAVSAHEHQASDAGTAFDFWSLERLAGVQDAPASRLLDRAAANVELEVEHLRSRAWTLRDHATQRTA